jgi:hypothetical protein
MLIDSIHLQLFVLRVVVNYDGCSLALKVVDLFLSEVLLSQHDLILRVDSLHINYVLDLPYLALCRGPYLDECLDVVLLSHVGTMKRSRSSKTNQATCDDRNEFDADVGIQI